MSGVAWPNGLDTPPRIGSRFGARAPIVTPGGVTNSFHYGTDMTGFADICSPVDGVVTFAAYNGGFGNFVRIRGDNGDEYGHAHIAPQGFYVGKGQRVRARQPIARMGTTGKSTGVHLHWEVYPRGGSAVDGVLYMQGQARPADGGSSPFVPKEWDEMATEEQIRNIVRGEVSLLGGLNQKVDETIVPVLERIEVSTLGTIERIDDSILPTLARESARAAAFEAALRALAEGGGSDPDAVADAAERGARAALDGLTFVARAE